MDLSRPSTRLQQEEIRRFLATGDSDPLSYAWEGGPLEGGRRAKNAMISALLAEVRRRSGERPPTKVPEALDLEEFVRSKVEPMVRGLFPQTEQDKVLSALERSITFVTEDTLEAVLRGRSFLRSAWDIANLYLGSVGAELLGEDAPRIVGLSEETSCFVSPAYFDSNGDRFADFVLHEAAHIFHNCKRVTIGLPARRGREWLLEIDFRMRETFALERAPRALLVYSLRLTRGARLDVGSRSDRTGLRVAHEAHPRWKPAAESVLGRSEQDEEGQPLRESASADRPVAGTPD